MAKDIAWVSRAPMDPSLNRGLTCEMFENDMPGTADAMRRNERGELLSPESLPKEFYDRYTGRKLKRLPNICNSGFWLVSAPVAYVMRKFDLGRTSLHPTRVFQNDRKTPVEGDYLCINLGERKASFLPEKSRARKPYESQDLWKLHLAPKNDDIALSEAAMDGPDLWVEAPHFIEAFFMSDRVVRALRDAKLTRHLGLRRCRVIQRS